jgi:N-acetylmuramoyl-L-alanine amidase
MLNYSNKGMVSKILGKQEIYYPILSQLSQAKADAEPVSSSVSSPTFGFGVTVSSDYLPQNSLLEGDFLRDKTVVIDPGHGDSGNQGSIGPNGAKEADIVLDIAKKFRDLLEEHGARVVMTRVTETTQLDNIRRGELANKENANIFVRIHADGSADPSQGGSQVTYMKDDSKNAAEIFHDELIKTIKTTNIRDLGVTKISFSEGFNAAKVPAISVNVAKISNPAEEILLQSENFKQKVTQALYNATKIYLLTTLN